jgi:hypothetical protein
MKKGILFVAFAIAFGLYLLPSCDRVTNPYPPLVNLELDTTLYPGNWSDYLANEWPTFTANTNTDRNVLIEDFTGHNCSSCPAAATIAHSLHEANPNRVFVASLHSGPTGITSFQAVNLTQGYSIDFTNPNVLELGNYFGTTLAGSGFFGNPAGSVNRINDAGEYFSGSGIWASKTAAQLTTSPKIAIKAKLNYYETPKHGFFLHTEVEKLDNALSNDLAMVVYVIEDSLIGQQNVNSVVTPNYVHRDIFRGTLDNQAWGQTLTSSMLTNGKYYLNYSYILPNQLAPQGQTSTHNAENMHVLIYV